MDTIVAIATSVSESAGINVIRVSGDDSLKMAKEVFSSAKLSGDFMPNMMYLGTICAKLFSEKAFCVYFKTPKSFTGEDVVEFHCHGGKGIANAIVRLLCDKGARPALPGEFTKRAFLNDKLTLTEAEGTLEMINARTEAEMLNAYRLINGDLNKSVDNLAGVLVQAIAMLEAKLDFPEEVEENTKDGAYAKLAGLRAELQESIARAERAKNIKDGVDIAIVGAPNAGKSSLLNAITGQDRAIVTDIPGTTRDVVNESVEVEGIRLNFLDTAGIREGENDIERMGIERSKAAIDRAEIVIFVQDGSVENRGEEEKIEMLTAGKRVVAVSNKTDIKRAEKKGIQISAKNRFNIDALIKEIMKKIGAESLFEQPVFVGERQIRALKDCQSCVENALQVYFEQPAECVLTDLREGLNALMSLSGKDGAESVAEEVFSAFCVGK